MVLRYALASQLCEFCSGSIQQNAVQFQNSSINHHMYYANTLSQTKLLTCAGVWQHLSKKSSQRVRISFMAIDRASVPSANKFEELFDNGDIVKYKGATHDLELRMIRLRLFYASFPLCSERALAPRRKHSQL